MIGLRKTDQLALGPICKRPDSCRAHLFVKSDAPARQHVRITGVNECDDAWLVRY
jgi:hypothetical protein